MHITRIVPNIPTERLDESREFYTSFFGFTVAMDMDWIVTLVSPGNPSAQISLIQTGTHELSCHTITLTIEVPDVDQLHSLAVSRGLVIVYPLTDEPWGVRRFHTVDPNGVTINVMMHLA